MNFNIALYDCYLKAKDDYNYIHVKQNSRIRETSNLSTDADRRTATILESLRDLSRKKKNIKKWGG